MIGRHRATIAAATTVAAALFVGGCGDSAASKPEPIDPTRVEKSIEVGIAEQAKKLSIVVCPTGIERAKGKRSICIATLGNGESYPFEVTQTDDKGSFHYEQVEGGTSSGDGRG